MKIVWSLQNASCFTGHIHIINVMALQGSPEGIFNSGDNYLGTTYTLGATAVEWQGWCHTPEEKFLSNTIWCIQLTYFFSVNTDSTSFALQCFSQMASKPHLRRSLGFFFFYLTTSKGLNIGVKRLVLIYLLWCDLLWEDIKDYKGKEK